MLTLSITRSTTCRGIILTPLSYYRNSVPALVHAEARSRRLPPLCLRAPLPAEVSFQLHYRNSVPALFRRSSLKTLDEIIFFEIPVYRLLEPPCAEPVYEFHLLHPVKVRLVQQLLCLLQCLFGPHAYEVDARPDSG